MKSFIPIILIGMCIAIYFMYIGPTISNIQVLGAKKTEYTDALSSIKQLKDHRDAVLVQYNAVAPTDIARLQKIIPDTTNNVDLVTNLNAIAAQYGMTIRQVQISPALTQDRSFANSAPVNSYQTTTIGFSTTAPYQQFQLFLRDLESNVHLFDVTSLSISSSQKVSSGGVFDYSVSVTTYSLQ